MKRYTLDHRGQRVAAAGFTLIEMIAVLVLIGIVMTIVGGKVMQNFQNGEYKAGVAGVHSLEMKVQAYMLDNGGAPSSLNDLVTRPSSASNWNGPYAKEADLKDPFDALYQGFSILTRRIALEERRAADVVIEPAIPPYHDMSDEVIRQHVEAGRAAAESALPRLRRLFAARAGSSSPARLAGGVTLP